MKPYSKPARLVLAGCLALAAAACEDHAKSVARGSPEYLHEALTGNVRAQKMLADCLASQTGCIGEPQDPAMACAWRSVRLESRIPTLSLEDTQSFIAGCASNDETFRQRAALGREEYTRRIYGRAPRAESTPAPGTLRLLYPSIESVRERVNKSLAGSGAPRLPAFGSPLTSADRQKLVWRSCAQEVCLDGETPAFGGGVFAFRISVGSGGNRARAKAALLAGAALDAPSVTAGLVSSASAAALDRMTVGQVCWTAGSDIVKGAAWAAAALGPC
jgi:hypothetical protein